MADSKKSVGTLVMGNHPSAELVGNLVITVISFLLLLLLGEYLWNNVLVKLTTIAKPAKNVWQVLGIMILAKLIFN
jgi:hypothetical protein